LLAPLLADVLFDIATERPDEASQPGKVPLVVEFSRAGDRAEYGRFAVIDLVVAVFEFIASGCQRFYGSPRSLLVEE
jgi:hypothetical protein